MHFQSLLIKPLRKAARIFLSLLLLPGLLLALGTLTTAISHAESNASLRKVVFSQFGKEKFLLYLPLYLAMEEGYFADEGLEVELRFAGNDDQIFASVMSGDALFGMGDPVFAAISKERGGPGKVVAMMITKLGLAGYTKNKSQPFIESASQLAGLRISSFPAPSTTYTFLTELIAKNNLAPTGTRIVSAAMGAQLATLEADEVDLAVDLEPTVSVAESKGYPVVFHLDKFTEPQAVTGITTLESTINTDPALVQKVVRALSRALVTLHTNRGTDARVAKKLFPTLSDQVISRALERMLSAAMYPRTPIVEDSLWQRTLRTRLEAGDLKKPQVTNVAVENSFAVKAAEGLAQKQH